MVESYHGNKNSRVACSFTDISKIRGTFSVILIIILLQALQLVRNLTVNPNKAKSYDKMLSMITKEPSTKTKERFRETFSCGLTYGMHSAGSYEMDWLLEQSPSILKLEENSWLRPRPIVGLTEDGTIYMSWEDNDYLFHADIDTVSEVIYWGVFNRKSEDIEEIDSSFLDIGSGNGWDELKNKLVDVFPTASEACSRFRCRTKTFNGGIK